jgi:hypothetical protein
VINFLQPWLFHIRMKKILTILFAVIIPVSGLQISLDRHYCGGRLADVRLSFSGRLASCGMEVKEPYCPASPAVENNCCGDQLTFYSLAGQYLPEQFRLKVPAWNLSVLHHPQQSLKAGNDMLLTLISFTFKSADDHRQRLKPPDICVFRI